MAGFQLVYWGLIFQRLAWYNPPVAAAKTSFPAISVIICARNEAANLQKNLESILTQDYPIFEVVVVDDCSTDQTAFILEILAKQYHHLKIVRVHKKEQLGKKAALTQGIEAAKYDWVLLTDADCFPSSNDWISTMAQQAQQAKGSIVLGYGPYEEKPTWLNRWVQFETIYVAIQYFSFALWRQPYMGVGRNLMYKKALFFNNKGFEKHQHLISGDDDLFINAVATNQNTAICLHPNSFMYSTAPTSWSALYRQKTRHYSSSTAYKLKHKIALGLLSTTHLYFYCGLCVFIAANVWNCAIIVILILRTFLVHLVFGRYLKKIKHIVFLKYVLCFDALLPIYYIIFASSLTKQKNKNWK